MKNKELFLNNLSLSYGIIKTACVLSNVSRQTVYNWMKEDADFKQRVSDINEEAIDFVEHKLFDKIQDNDTTAIIFFLKTKAKHRGYSEHSQDTGASSGGVLYIESPDNPLLDGEYVDYDEIAEKQAKVDELPSGND